MKHIIRMAAMAAIGGIVSAALVHGQSSPAEGERSGSIAINSSQENYPDGSKWPAPQYEKPKTDLSFRAEEMVHGGAMSAAASSKIQIELPAKITLGAAKAIRFSQDVPTERLTGMRLKDGAQT